MELVERDAELGAVREALEDARAGMGALVVLEAPAGQGKTALLRASREQGRALGMRVLSATGAALERDFPFGVVRQLLEGEFRSSDPERAERLLEGAATQARGVFEAAPDPDTATDVSLAQLNGLFWFTVNLSEEQPLLLVVDDAHWADGPSLRFLDVLARRIEDLPVAVAIGARPAEPGAEQDLLDSLILSSQATVLRPDALSEQAVRVVLEAALGREVHPAFAAVCADLTGGNALFVRELARTLKAEGLSGQAAELDAVRAAVPPSVARSVVRRLRHLSPPAHQLVKAVAVLGERAEHRYLRTLAGLNGEADAAHREAAASGLLDPERPRFVHPLVAEAVRADMSGAERGALHRRAADLLDKAGGDSDAVAAHLTASEPAADPEVARHLAAAGRRALAGGAPDAAVRLLERALQEPPAAGERPAILLDLGIAESRIGSAEGVRHLEAAAGTGDRVIRARAVVARTATGIFRGHDPRAIGDLRELLDRPEDFDHHLVCRIECGLLNLLPFNGDLQEEYVDRLHAGAQAERSAALAHLAFHRAIAGHQQNDVIALARRALEPSRILEEFEMESNAPYYALEALFQVEAAADVSTALRDARAAAQRSGSPLATAWVAHAETLGHRLFGRLPDAIAELEPAVEAVRDTDAEWGATGMIVGFAAALADQHEFEKAEHVLGPVFSQRLEPNSGMISLPTVVGRVQLGLGRPAEALQEFDRQLAFERTRGWRLSPREMTRTHRVAALAGVGRGEEARQEAMTEIAFAQERGVAGHEARARLAHAALLDRDEAITELERAADAARRSPSTLVLAEALGALGAAQRRGNRRAEARETLKEARELAHRCGASGLEERIHEELVVAGARPQRIALAGVESLTAAERRVAELAAQGMRNREIAETLFVTLKTVEVHLGRAYGKLDIRGRSQLPEALGVRSS